MYYSKLYDTLSEYIDLDRQDKKLVETLFRHESAEKGKILIERGKPAEKAYFIFSGYLRYFKTTSSGDDLIIHLFSPGDFATSMVGFFTGAPAQEYLQTVTNCELLSITRDDLGKLYSAGTKWQIFGRRLMENMLLEKEVRIIDQISLPALDRYSKLLADRPDIIQNVPVKDIASFIGIKPESLSRIRKTI
jgi:CRP-like cAMP-binding protein